MSVTFRSIAAVLLISPAFAVPEGFEIHEFAGPPDAEYPTAVMAAANGDVYVSSDRNGSLGKKEGMGRIIRCRDTDGDGKADDFHDFVPVVNSPRGGDFVGDTLYLIHPPYLSSYRDTNGDGTADETKLLVSGLGGGIEHPRGADHTTNGVRMGIDGWLYVSVGDFGMADAKGADGTRYTLFGGGVVRVRPDGSGLEPYALMTRNICDTAISPRLDLFSRDNTNDGKGWNTRFHHHTALADHGYPRLYQNFSDEALAPLADYGGGSGTGALWLHEPGFPGEFGDMLYSCDWTTGNVYFHSVEEDGESFRPAQEVFHKLPRATDLDVDGSSRLYLTDWRNGKFNDAGPKVKVGMILQATCPGETPASYREVKKADDGELVKLVGSRSGVQRLEAQWEMLRRGMKPVFAEGLFAMAKDAEQPVYARVAAVFTFKQLYGKESSKYLAELAEDEVMREFALRAMTDRKGELEGVPVKAYLDGVKDANPRVVLQALIGLERLKAGAAEILAASQGWNEAEVSPRLRHTAVAVLASLGAVDECLAGVDDPATRALALRALERMHRTEVVDGLLAKVVAAKEGDLRFDLLQAVARLHFKEKAWDLEFWWGTRPDDRGPYFELEEWEHSPRIKAALEKGMSMISPDRQGEYLEGLARNRIEVSELTLPGLDPLMAALGATALDKGQVALLIAAGKDPRRAFEQRLQCYRALERAPEKAVTGLKLEVLGTWSDEENLPAEAARQVEDFINATQRGMEVKELRGIAAKRSNAESRIAWRSLLTVLNSPLAKGQWQERVKKMIAENPREVGFFQALTDMKLAGFEEQIAVGLDSDNDELIDVAQAAKEACAEASGGGKKVAELPIDEVTERVMAERGDPVAGERLFTSQGCIACHAVDLTAEQKGPFLGSAGAKFTRDYLIDSILDPNKVVAQGFQTSMFLMKDGSAATGFVTAEADGVIEVRDVAGQVSRLKRGDVKEEQHLPNSLMPPGLAGMLTVEELTSMVEYLVSMEGEE